MAESGEEGPRPHSEGGLTYAAAGVDIEAGEEAVRRIRVYAEATYTPNVIGGIGGFGGLFQVPSGYVSPVLVAATDGVGTKVILARQAGRLETVGIDLVAMSVNDVLTLGARPLFFLDYIATGRLLPEEIERLVKGVADGCQMADCALLGGEMAEMPGLYAPGDFDLAGFCVGIVERARIIDGSCVEPGDVILGLASSGVHSNGYSLVRRILESRGLSLEDRLPLSSRPLSDLLLEPTRIYVKSVLALLEREVPIHAMAHITGGGLGGNVSRVIPAGLSARLHVNSWEVPALFRTLQELGHVSDEEMFRTFNMGIGFVVVLPRDCAAHATRLLSSLGEQVIRLGRIVRGKDRVAFEEGDL